MSLATRCAACGTVFRVVQDQLKVSEGWVRCGRCNDVFNALEGLFDLDREAPPAGADTGTDVSAASADATDPLTGVPATPEQDVFVALHPAAPGPQDSDESFAPPTSTGARPRHAEGGSLVERLDGHFFGTRRGDHNTTSIDKRDRLEFSDARFDTDLLADEDPADDDNASPASVALESERREMPAPEFVRRAQRTARWQRPRIRLALGAAASLLLVVLAFQTVHHFRDLIAARWPQTRVALAAWCSVADCTLGAPRRIGAISVESTSLAQTALPQAFRLSVSLRNRGSLALALPWVELSLTDTSGRLVARRALSGADFRAASTVLQPGAEQALQLLLSAGSAPVSGYTVEIFYP